MSERIKIFGEHLRCLRIQAGLSQEVLAERAGIHTTYVGQLERGEKKPNRRHRDEAVPWAGRPHRADVRASGRCGCGGYPGAMLRAGALPAGSGTEGAARPFEKDHRIPRSVKKRLCPNRGGLFLLACRFAPLAGTSRASPSRGAGRFCVQKNHV